MSKKAKEMAKQDKARPKPADLPPKGGKDTSVKGGAGKWVQA